MHSSDAYAAPLASARRVDAELADLNVDALRHALAGVSRLLTNTASIDTSGLRTVLQTFADSTATIRSQRDNMAHAVGQVTPFLVETRSLSDRLAQVSLDVTQTLGRALDGMDVSIDPAALNPLLDSLSTLDIGRLLTREQRDQAADAVRTAATAADSADDVLPDDLAAVVRGITAADVGDLPLTVNRQTFRLFFATVVLFSLMTLAFSNESADGVVGKALELSPLAGLAMMAAGKLWDRINGEQEDDTPASQGE